MFGYVLHAISLSQGKPTMSHQFNSDELIEKKTIVEKVEVTIEVYLRRNLAQIVGMVLEPDSIFDSYLKRIDYDDGKVTVLLEGKDLSELRAGINSYQRLVGLFVSILDSLCFKESKIYAHHNLEKTI